MEPLGPKIRRQRRRLGLTLDELAGRTGISKPYLSLIETGRIPNPPSDEKLRKLEQSLGFAAAELITQAHLQRTPSDVREMLRKLLALQAGTNVDLAEKSVPATDVNDAFLSGVLHQLVGKAGDGLAPAASGAVPVINKVSAGYPRDIKDLAHLPRSAGDYVSCPDIHDRDAFAVRVTGDTMMPRYRQGDIVIFSPILSARSGDDCFIRFEDGQTTFKRVFFESDEDGEPTLRLQPRNEKYRSQTLRPEKVVGLHRAVYRYERVDEPAL